MKLKIIIEKEPNNEGYHAYCPSLKGCHSCGTNKRETIKNIKEAIALYLEPEPEVIKRELIREHLFHPELVEIAI
jgi:predicted RNase H-like HicB family nuclease